MLPKILLHQIMPTRFTFKVNVKTTTLRICYRFIYSEQGKKKEKSMKELQDELGLDQRIFENIQIEVYLSWSFKNWNLLRERKATPNDSWNKQTNKWTGDKHHESQVWISKPAFQSSVSRRTLHMHQYLFFLINKQKFYWKNTTTDTCTMNIKESKELQIYINIM